eukprot:8901887-Heterocapsa_arctica.AAC.1
MQRKSEKCKGTCKYNIKGNGRTQEERYKSETSQKCAQNASFSYAQSKRSNRDNGNREKQHNYVKGPP